jgi:hypothetical protein
MATEQVLAVLDVVVHAPVDRHCCHRFLPGPSYTTRTFLMGLVRGHTPRHTTSAVREYYITIPIDDNIAKCYATCGSASVRLQDRNLPARLAGEFQITIHHTRLDQVQCSSNAWKYSKTLPGNFDLSALAAGESHPLSRSSATEIGICIGNCFFAYQVSLRFCRMARLCLGPIEMRWSRSQMIFE